jgi:NAD-dependent deacetylase
MPDERERAREMLASARGILVLTGAGVSAESGVPTFRGASGLWKSFRAEELATPEAFARDPRLVWEWYGWRRMLVAACAPNEAHRALARLALRRDDVGIVTQNVDELHVVAARDEATNADPAAALPLELHGSLFRARCTQCGARTACRGTIDARDRETLPACERCGGLLRPDIVWFGETLDPAVLDAAMALARRADLCLVVGTSAIVYPAAGFAAMVAEHGGRVIEVNPERTPLSAAADLSLRGTAVEIVPEITRG